MRYVVDAGGVALTADYPYRGQAGYCRWAKGRWVGGLDDNCLLRADRMLQVAGRYA